MEAPGEPAEAVIERLAEGVEPGLMAMGSPRFFGWVIGSSHPVGVAADIKFGYSANQVGFGWTNGVVLDLLAGMR